MKLLFITPGSGDNFYCENCMRDRALVQALSKNGADVVFMPLYLPVELSEQNSSVEQGPLFFGGINVWLEQKVLFYKYLPHCITRLFDSRWMLRLAAKRAGMTNPATLGDMTLSMLQGSSGQQAKQLDELIDWLKIPANTPDIVCLSNALLSGIAPDIKQKLNVPVVSFLQDEDGFLDSLGEYSNKCWQQLLANCNHINHFIAVSDFYARLMADRMNLQQNHISACYSGVDFSQYSQINRKTEGPLTIGYLSRICQVKGFDRLVQAYISLKARPQLADLKLIVSGGSIGDDQFIAQQKQIIKDAGYESDVRFCDNFVDMADRLAFFGEIDLLCVPEREAVAHGRYFIEAAASNIPTLVPNIGVFTELAEKVSPDLVFSAENDDDLIDKLQAILAGKISGEKLREKAINHFDINNNAKQILDTLTSLVNKR